MAEDDINDIDDAAPPVVSELSDDPPPRNNQTRNIIIAICIAALVILTSLILLWNRAKPAGEEKEEVVVSVKVAKAEKDTIAKEVSAVGTVVPSERADVAASISAQIKQMGLLKNKLVHEGDPLAVLSSEDLMAQRNEAAAAVEEAKLNLQTVQKVQIPQATAQATKDVTDAKAAVDNTRATYERRKVLYDKGGISLKDLEASELAYTNAQDAYRLALSNAQINRTGVNPNSQSVAVAKIEIAIIARRPAVAAARAKAGPVPRPRRFPIDRESAASSSSRRCRHFSRPSAGAS